MTMTIDARTMSCQGLQNVLVLRDGTPTYYGHPDEVVEHYQEEMERRGEHVYGCDITTPEPCPFLS